MTNDEKRGLIRKIHDESNPKTNVMSAALAVIDSIKLDIPDKYENTLNAEIYCNLVVNILASSLEICTKFLRSLTENDGEIAKLIGSAFYHKFKHERFMIDDEKVEH